FFVSTSSTSIHYGILIIQKKTVGKSGFFGFVDSLRRLVLSSLLFLSRFKQAKEVTGERQCR
ncbi:hypothetical protein, partial [Bacillus smithii]|uniref:hypothetical protein n=1 Tax=Bacillus smithii TaxID=1479 RepID=UPI002E20D6E9|nr:hypothetical protein [Bacillus smithii]